MSTILASTMPTLARNEICAHDGPLERLAPSSIRLSGTAASPTVETPSSSQ